MALGRYQSSMRPGFRKAARVGPPECALNGHFGCLHGSAVTESEPSEPASGLAGGAGARSSCLAGGAVSGGFMTGTAVCCPRSRRRFRLRLPLLGALVVSLAA